MSCIRKPLRQRAILLAISCVVALHAADEKKDENKKDPPKVTMAVPFAVIPGATNKIVIRGVSLTNATAIRFPSASNLIAEIKNTGRAAIPDKGDPKKLGNAQLEVHLAVPEDFMAGDLPFSVLTPDGETNTNLLHVVAAKLLGEEKEPNGGFRKANDVSLPRFIRGIIGEANDVDVFRLAGKAGQRINIETRSAGYGSTLDPILTLHDARGRVMKTSDDAAGVDAHIVMTLPMEGDYFISITDAHERGGATYTYLIEVR